MERVITFRMPGCLHSLIKVKAAANNVSMNAYILDAIRKRVLPEEWDAAVKGDNIVVASEVK